MMVSQLACLRGGERAPGGAAVGAEVVPDQDDRGAQGAVRGGDQRGVVSLGHGAALALAPAVQPQAEEEPAGRTRLQAGQARDGHAAGALPADPGHGRAAPPCPGTRPRRPQVLPGLVLEADPRPDRGR